MFCDVHVMCCVVRACVHSCVHASVCVCVCVNVACVLRVRARVVCFCGCFVRGICALTGFKRDNLDDKEATKLQNFDRIITANISATIQYLLAPGAEETTLREMCKQIFAENQSLICAPQGQFAQLRFAQSHTLTAFGLFKPISNFGSVHGNIRFPLKCSVLALCVQVGSMGLHTQTPINSSQVSTKPQAKRTGHFVESEKPFKACETMRT